MRAGNNGITISSEFHVRPAVVTDPIRHATICSRIAVLGNYVCKLPCFPPSKVRRMPSIHPIKGFAIAGRMLIVPPLNKVQGLLGFGILTFTLPM